MNQPPDKYKKLYGEYKVIKYVRGCHQSTLLSAVGEAATSLIHDMATHSKSVDLASVKIIVRDDNTPLLLNFDGMRRLTVGIKYSLEE